MHVDLFQPAPPDLSQVAIFAATGHRPEKLGGYSPEVDARLRRLALTFLGGKRPKQIISGLALGWDLAWAEAGLLLGIPVIGALPFREYSYRWPEASQQRLFRVMQSCASVEVISPGNYAAWKMQTRNEWMVDRCEVLVALYNGDRGGGTANCVLYAQAKSKPITNLWPQWESQS